MAKGGGSKAGGGKGGGGAIAVASTGLTEKSALSAIDSAANNIGRALIADVRDKIGGTRAEQDAMLKSMQTSGKIVLYSNDVPRSITPRERAAGIQFGNPEFAAPRTIVYRVK